MLIQPTLELLHELRLTGMVEAFEQQLGIDVVLFSESALLFGTQHNGAGPDGR